MLVKYKTMNGAHGQPKPVFLIGARINGALRIQSRGKACWSKNPFTTIGVAPEMDQRVGASNCSCCNLRFTFITKYTQCSMIKLRLRFAPFSITVQAKLGSLLAIPCKAQEF